MKKRIKIYFTVAYFIGIIIPFLITFLENASLSLPIYLIFALIVYPILLYYLYLISVKSALPLIGDINWNGKRKIINDDKITSGSIKGKKVEDNNIKEDDGAAVGVGEHRVPGKDKDK